MQTEVNANRQCKELFMLYCNDDRRGSQQFVMIYGSKMLRQIRRIRCFDTLEDWEDSLQEVWLKLIGVCAKPIREESCEGYLMTLARNQAIDDLRKQHKPTVKNDEKDKKKDDEEIPLDQGLEMTGDGGRRQPDTPQDLRDKHKETPDLKQWRETVEAAEQVRADEQRDRWLYVAIAALPDKQRQAVRLYLQGYSRKEIADCMVEGEETVKNHLRLAKDKLKKQLEHEQATNPDSWS